MSRKLSSQDFLKLFDTLWENTAPTKYKNPDAWTLN
jgi:hypothetical protein